MNGKIIGKESGFEIVKQDEKIIFVNRGTLALAVAAMVNGGIALLAGAWSGISLVMGLRGGFAMPAAGYAAGIFCAVFVVFLFLAIYVFRLYRRRARRPIMEIPSAIIADLLRGELLNKDGEVICRLDEISLKSSISLLDHSRGLMRLLMLKTPRGNFRVFKTNSGKTLEEVRRRLIAAGFPVGRMKNDG